MRLVIGSDHGGFSLKESIKEHLINRGIDVEDYGTFSEESVDYPDYALKVGLAVANGEFDGGILCCGTGIGVSIAANKVKGIRAAHVTDCFSAKYAKEHNNANIICLGGRVTGPGLADMIVDEWLDSEFQGGRHTRRIKKIAEIERENLQGEEC